MARGVPSPSYRSARRQFSCWVSRRDFDRIKSLYAASGLKNLGDFVSQLLICYEARRLEGTGAFVTRRITQTQANLALQAVVREVEFYRRLIDQAKLERDFSRVERLRRIMGMFLDLEDFLREAGAAAGESLWQVMSGAKVPRDRRKTPPRPAKSESV
jgi:hypothetical protein